jgi:hypothetical protein
MASARPLFQETQYALAAHLRDPENNPAPAGVEERRLEIYRELFYNNVEGFLAGAFPVLRRITADAVWHALVRDFYARHRCQTPLFHRIAQEFLEYLDSERGARSGDWPFLRDLAHYEWVELALSVAEEELTPEIADPNGDLLQGIPVVSPLAWALSYDFPVHRIAPAFLPESPGPPTYLIVYRTRQYDVKFMEVNAVTARLMQLLEQEPDRGETLLRRIAAELGAAEAAVLQEGARILGDLRVRDVVVGTRW